MIKVEQLTDEQRRGVSEGARILAAADGVPLLQATQTLLKEPGRLLALGRRISVTAEALGALEREQEALSEESAPNHEEGRES